MNMLPRQAASPIVKYLIILILIVALTAGSTIACGEGDNEEQGPSSRGSFEQDSSRPDGGGRQGSTPPPGNTEEVENNDGPATQPVKADAIELPKSGETGRAASGRSLQILESLPNLEFNWILLMDAVALRNEDVPQEIVAKAKGKYDWMGYVEDIATREGKTGIFLQDVDTMIVADWGQPMVFTVQGTYDSKSVGNYIDPLAKYDRIEPEGSSYQAWQLRGTIELTSMFGNQAYSGSITRTRE